MRNLTISIALTALIPAATLQSQTLHGTVKDSDSGTPIADASVVLMDDAGRIQRGTLTEPDGSFVLVAPGAGTYTLRVGAAGYAVQDTPPMRVEDGTDARVDLVLQSENQQSGLPMGVTQRMASGRGIFITREQIEQRSGDRFTDIFQFTPAVRVIALPASSRMNAAESTPGQMTSFSRRGEAAVGSITQPMTLRIKAGRDFNQAVVGAVQQGEQAHDCPPVLWVDGIWWGNIDEASSFGPNGALAPGDVYAIEVYNHPSVLPEQFNTGRDSLCGVIVVWTSRSVKR
jgi:hypothetical protein